MNAQQIVAANVAARGYRDGWTTDQFVARQVYKLTEELDEIAGNIYPPFLYQAVEWRNDLHRAGMNARKTFDSKHGWDIAGLGSRDTICSELADLVVVLLTAAEALEFDVIQAAIDKSAADVARGVR